MKSQVSKTPKTSKKTDMLSKSSGKFQPTTKFTPKSSKKLTKKDVGEKVEAEITDYISANGEIMYPKLIKDEITKCDKELLEASKKSGNIGGKMIV